MLSLLPSGVTPGIGKEDIVAKTIKGLFTWYCQEYDNYNDFWDYLLDNGWDDDRIEKATETHPQYFDGSQIPLSREDEWNNIDRYDRPW
jgi:hypothetical protein